MLGEIKGQSQFYVETASFIYVKFLFTSSDSVSNPD